MKKRYENSIKLKLQHMMEEDKELMKELPTFPPGSFGAEEIKLVMDLNSMISNMLIGLIPKKLEEVKDTEQYARREIPMSEESKQDGKPEAVFPELGDFKLNEDDDRELYNAVKGE